MKGIYPVLPDLPTRAVDPYLLDLADLAGGMRPVEFADRQQLAKVLGHTAERVRADVGIQDKGLAYYHAWAFGTIRQLGAAFELAALNLKWLAAHGTTGLETATAAFERLSEANKTFILKGARATHSRRPFDSAPLFDSMAAEWEGGMAALQASL
jgi:Domain of unknown function (DUF1839)